MKTFEFTDEQNMEIFLSMSPLNTIRRTDIIKRIEAIVSERITPEPGESGQSAEDVLKGMYGNNTQYGYSFNSTIEAMRLHASQVCADKDREIDALNWAARMNRSDFLKAQSELDKANESLTVMLRKNADLEKEIVDCKKSMLSAGMISGKDAEKFTKRHNISIENIDLRKIENGYDINNPKTK